MSVWEDLFYQRLGRYAPPHGTETASAIVDAVPQILTVSAPRKSIIRRATPTHKNATSPKASAKNDFRAALSLSLSLSQNDLKRSLFS